eukprot:CAMPEP_0171348910 /NCGR_PEP_ID=MMETSP0878-20121228/32212_1 /TAXON_ID=67004 /ORGANISM="Thalassiosira weissflogii, Strain CCMP1336" /LENGTH=40 /DNA_ID= /DNA_START= /DNA_END= /DNA_ORIENTATION=
MADIGACTATEAVESNPQPPQETSKLQESTQRKDPPTSTT